MLKIKDVFASFNLFQTLFRTHSPAYIPSIDFAKALDLEYIYNWAGEKNPSPLVKAFLIDDVVSEDGVNNLASIIYSHFNLKWEQTYNTQHFEYVPIHNVDEHEVTKTTDSFGHIVDLRNNVNAFNDDSFDGVPSDNHNETNSGKDIQDYTRDRKGNIGVTSTQDLITQEREVWQWDYIYQLFRDVDSVLTLRVYEVEKGELI